jgi:hypothetical protein
MALTYFPVTAILKAVVSDTSGDVDGTPDIQYISCFVHFTPSVNQVYSTTDHTMYKLATIRARTNPSDGVLKNIDGTPVSLVANTTELDIDELTYKVSFTNVVYGEAEQTIQPFSFVAPIGNTAIDLTTVDRI